MTTDRVFEDLWQGYLSFGVPDSPVNRTALHTAYVMTGMYNACDPPHLMGFRALFSHRRKEWSLYVGVIVVDVFVPVMAVIRDDIIGPTQDDLRCTPTCTDPECVGVARTTGMDAIDKVLAMPVDEVSLEFDRISEYGLRDTETGKGEEGDKATGQGDSS